MKKLILMAAVMAAPFLSQAQTVANTYTNLSVLPTSMSAGSTSNLVSAPIYINPGFGLSLQLSATTGAGVTGSNVTAKVNVSIDGTNWPSVAPYSAAFAVTASTTNVLATNFPSWFFDGFAKARVESLTTTTTNALTIDSVKFGRAKQSFTAPN